MKATTTALTMKPVTREELRMLARGHAAPCLSLLMPTHRTQPDNAQDPLRFRNLLSRLEDEVAERYPAADRPELLAPLRALDDEAFWRHQTGGLAIYRSPDLAVLYRVPRELPERAIVADSFHLKPLVPFAQANRSFFVLHLSREKVALYQGSPRGLTPLAPADLPDSIHAALRSELHIRHVGLHLTDRGGGVGGYPNEGGGRPTYHGHGGAEADQEAAVLRFVQAVDAGLWRVLRGETAPLVLVGVDYYHPVFRAETRYPHLLDEGVHGNYERASLDELHARVWPIVERDLRRREDEALADYQDRVKYGRATEDLSAIGRFAIEGRVERLLLGRGVELTGRFDRQTGRLELGEAASQGADDPLDDLAEEVLVRGGDVLVIDRDRLPADAAALLRW